MSYEEFRRRIDTARNILVGAVPSPAGQIDQITYAMMYKFMNDIDDQAAALGGKRSYFIGDYEQYNWHKLMSSSLGAHERLELYRQAIQTMAKNPNIPELFRSIYQNAFLPFNSPNILNLFLKEIDKFNHGESDDIGDAYEYLLSITGAQGDVGQFRTPRHIIKFIVEAVNPTKDDTVIDPACGTAGFLISAYNHVRTQHDGKNADGSANDEQRLTASELDKIHHNYRGFDIDPTMVRTAKVNLYLHGFKTPDIINHDSLSSEDYWNDRYDVILANPPFMTPKGGIQPHKKFGISANRAEVLFVDYIASHLKPSGRAGIIVPEGVIFQSGKAYKELRKNLVENSLYAVISLPSGVFNPYAGVKTSILLLDKELAKQNDEVLFVKVENDGYSLGAQRRKIAGDQFPEALEVIEHFKNGEELQTEFAHAVKKSEIAESGDFNLSGDRYKLASAAYMGDWPTYKLKELETSGDITLGRGKVISKIDLEKSPGKFPVYSSSAQGVGEFGRYGEYMFDEEMITWSVDGGGRFFYRPKHKYSVTNVSGWLRVNNALKVDAKYLYHVLDYDWQSKTFDYTSKAHPSVIREVYEIPLPPIEIQREIVAELDGYQKIIDAAQTIVKTYKPTIKINPDWAIVKIGDQVKIERGASPRPIDKYMTSESNGENWVMIGDTKNVTKYITETAKKVTTEGASKSRKVEPGDFVLSNSMSFGRPYIMKTAGYIHDGWLVLRMSDTESIDQDFLYYLLGTEYVQSQFEAAATGGVVRNLNSDLVRNTKIPLPPIEIQREIVAELEAEQKLIDANKKLIETFQAKIKSKITEVWGE